MKVSIGIMAYNEAANIGRLLDNLCQQKLKIVRIREIIVVASGCTDGTEAIVKEKAKEDKRIKLVRQKVRRGKASAVNLFIKRAKLGVLVMISADTLPALDAIEKLVIPFSDKKMGMTAGRIMPVNKPDGFLNFYVITLWRLHHEVAKRKLKAGEMVAWRNVVKGIDPLASVDESNIEALIIQKGLKTAYVANALVYNRGPGTFADVLKMRRRQLAGYHYLRSKLGFTPSTMNNLMVLWLYLTKTRLKSFQEVIWMIGVLGLESLLRLIAWYDWLIKKEHHPVWPMVKTTKKLPKTI